MPLSGSQILPSGGHVGRVVSVCAEHSNYKRNADQLVMEVIGMLWEVGEERFC